jgi:hypothetical protein
VGGCNPGQATSWPTPIGDIGSPGSIPPRTTRSVQQTASTTAAPCARLMPSRRPFARRLIWGAVKPPGGAACLHPNKPRARSRAHAMYSTCTRGGFVMSGFIGALVASYSLRTLYSTGYAAHVQYTTEDSAGPATIRWVSGVSAIDHEDRQLRP